MTFRQAQELGAHVRKGERGTLVVYANRVTKTETSDAGGEHTVQIPSLRGYTVFNADQIEGLPAHYYAKPAAKFESAAQRIEHAETFFAATGADIRFGGGRAFYRQDADYVQMPPPEAFPQAEAFYSTLAHEVCHWTKTPQRLNRGFWQEELGRRRLRYRGTGGRAGRCVSVR